MFDGPGLSHCLQAAASITPEAAGASVGAVVFLFLLVLIVVMVIRRRRRPVKPKVPYASDDVFAQENELEKQQAMDTRTLSSTGDNDVTGMISINRLDDGIILPPAVGTIKKALPTEAELLAELDYILHPPVPTATPTIWSYHPEFWVCVSIR